MGVFRDLFGGVREPSRRRGRPIGATSDVVATRNAQIIAERVAGASIQELCVRYGFNRSYLYKIVGDTLREPKTPHPNGLEFIERNNTFRQLYEDGLSATEIADFNGLSRERVCQVLRKTNTIELRAGRRRMAKEALQTELAARKAEAKEALDVRVAQAVELVRAGKSIASAAREVDMAHSYQVVTIQHACKQAGVASNHGRWQDFGPKIARVRALRSEGKPWTEVDRICTAEGFGRVHASWVSNHCPDLVAGRVPRVGAASPKVAVPKADLDAMWTPEKTQELLALWFKGASAQQCADILGSPVTRNAVVGKINRLRVAGQFAKPEEVHEEK